MTRVSTGIIVALASCLGLFMTFDGLRALLVGDYLTPTTGAYAGQLGPWSGVVSAVGIAPRSTAMKSVFVILGASWLTSIVGFLRRASWSPRALAILAVTTLWYLPIGTLCSILLLVALTAHARRTRQAARIPALTRDPPLPD